MCLLFKKRIVVGLTTTTKRIESIIPTLESLMKQSVKPEKIVLTLAYEMARTGETFGRIPVQLLSYIRDKPIEIIRTPDYGPATKFVGLLLTEHDEPETYLVWFDDDVVYNKNAIKILVQAASKSKKSVACASMFEVSARTCTSVGKFTKLSKNNFYVFESYGGVCCRVRDMPKAHAFPYYTHGEYKALSGDDRYKFNSDNFMLSYYLYKNKVDFVLVYDVTCDMLRDVGMGPDALHNVQNHTSVYKYLYSIVDF